ncbi:DNA-binding transcriptional regulator, AcrR family [Bosea sp. CRIB-10]|uniref:TetR/AcrR family transcriptional regulator n=1 Tax=Bosea sp. CRIB-10 TaxID=378404 RepID=UPI0008EEA546|nr:TetR/AcrR family transcriptional regulator [Bosea sp. CRIB-10]SFC50584.1 DNA-binding transcriptional regulator, AcrR family [Bosea sp. CRIB-10]
MRRSKKSELLEAAGAIIVRSGVEALTFDRLAAEAGVSKGGILYHFPDKERLLVALVEGIVALTEFAIAEAMQTEPVRPGRWLRAYIRVAFTNGDEIDRLLGALIAALPPESAALVPLLDADRRWLEAACDDGLPRGLAIAIRLAVDGAFFTRLNESDAATTRETLLKLTEQL